MKKLSLIVIVALLVVVTSCQKEVVSPASSSTVNQPAWASDNATDDGKGKTSTSTDKAADTGGDSGIGVNEGSSGADDGGITDPNKDPDANKRKGSKGKK